MRFRRRMAYATACVVLFIGALGGGCARRGTSTQPVPAEYRITQAVATLTEASKAAAEITIQLNKSGVVSDRSTAEILGYTATVAQGCKAALTTMDGDASFDAKRSEIRGTFARLTETEGIRRFLENNQDTPAARSAVAALQMLQLLIEAVVREVNS